VFRVLAEPIEERVTFDAGRHCLAPPQIGASTSVNLLHRVCEAHDDARQLTVVYASFTV
jgi:hypothetical protein